MLRVVPWRRGARSSTARRSGNSRRLGGSGSPSRPRAQSPTAQWPRAQSPRAQSLPAQSLPAPRLPNRCRRLCPVPRPERAVARDSDGAVRAGQGIEGRRTVTIHGRGAERNLPMARPTLRRHERPGTDLTGPPCGPWLLGVLLILVAAASAHAAVLSHLAH